MTNLIKTFSIVIIIANLSFSAALAKDLPKTEVMTKAASENTKTPIISPPTEFRADLDAIAAYEAAPSLVKLKGENKANINKQKKTINNDFIPINYKTN